MGEKVKNTLANILTWIVIGFLVLGLIIMYAVSKADVFNFYIFSFGLVLSVVSGLILWIQIKWGTKVEKPLINTEINRLKTNGHKIVVDLLECEIKSNNWASEGPRYENDKIQMLNAVGGDPELNVKYVDNMVSKILYKTEFMGKEYDFISRSYSKDVHTLRMLLDIQKNTNIYLDKNNSNIYYFDLEFLDN